MINGQATVPEALAPLTRGTKPVPKRALVMMALILRHADRIAQAQSGQFTIHFGRDGVVYGFLNEKIE